MALALFAMEWRGAQILPRNWHNAAGERLTLHFTIGSKMRKVNEQC